MTFEYTHVERPDSSAIEVIAYHNVTGDLYVQFTGGNWVTYDEILESFYQLFIDASSVGRFYNYYIRQDDDVKSSDRGDFPLALVEVETVEDTVESVVLPDAPAAPVWGSPEAMANPSKDRYGDGKPLFVEKRPVGRRYRIAWERNAAIGGNYEVYADNEELALIEFNQQVELSQPFVDADYFDGLRVTSITRYFD